MTLPMLLACISLLTWIGFARVAAQETSASDLALIASSPFRMILSPVDTELDFRATQILETSITSTLLVEQAATEYTEMEAVIQQVESTAAVDDPAIRVRFFVLATVLVENESDTAVQRTALNQLIESTFDDSMGRGQLMTLLKDSGDATLSAVTTVLVGAIAPAPATEEPGSKGLATLDIVLIVVSTAIFLGIAYMVIQHVKDRGYIENQRLIALNSASRTQTTGESLADKNRMVGQSNSKDEETPSTPSTTGSGIEPSLETPERGRPVRISAVTTNVGELKEVGVASAASMEEHPVEYFEQNWFKVVGTAPKFPPDKEEGSSSGSEDVFHIDVEADDSYHNSNDDAASRASSRAVAIAEWMKTIRVVSMDSRSVLTTSTGSKGPSKSSSSSSTEASVDHSSLDQSSLEQVSLEHSMADSTVSEKKARRRMEV